MIKNFMASVLDDIEQKSWEEKNEASWRAVLTYEHGGRYYSFRLEKVELSQEHPSGIDEKWLREIADALPKKLRPMADGLPRRFTLAASRIESKRQRKI